MSVLYDAGCLAPVWWRSTRRSLILQRDQTIWMMTLVRIRIQNHEAGQGRLFESVTLLSPDYPPGYTPEVKLSKNLIGSAKGGFTVPDAERRWII